MLKRGILLSGSLTLTIILTGCFQGEQSMEEEMDPPQNAEEVNNLEEVQENEETESVDEGANEETAETVPRELYLIDSNGMVASQTLELPKLESMEVATQVLEHLVKGGPVTSMLPNGFRAVLPEGTQILGLDLKDNGTMIVDVSSEFEDYEANDELKILESMTHTLTQFENVKKMELRINGHPQSEMPVNGTPIGDGYSRANGINVTETDTLDLIKSTPVTMYYPAEHNESRYYVPVTQYVEGTDEELYSSIVQALIDGPGYNANVTHVFNSQTMLTNSPTLDNGVLELEFSETILKDDEKSVIADEVMETIVRTLTEQQSVEAVNVKVENVDQIVNENGEAYTEPVSIQTFTPTEKL
ncbi:spore gernimation protein [Virgibacillus indicus]|uniref:Spore gernimation protein n=1 Tax=Virgibacillus indicus TaxID=2024554 RepID=A0A265NEU3_9BACI|nr:GerMN domain-containing protein [Virgibacillus indicus]OZU89796.1 spore gernimation protein [Virgibacillus indicus]